MHHSTSFHKVRRLNEIAGNPSNAAMWKEIETQFKYITREFHELEKAIKERNIIAMADAAADLHVTTYGLESRVGLDANVIMNEVASALETRFDATPEDAALTQAKYAKLDVETYVVEVPYEGRVYYITRSTKQQTGTDNEIYDAHKWLKSYRFREPNLSPLIDESVFDRLNVDTAPVPEGVQSA